MTSDDSSREERAVHSRPAAAATVVRARAADAQAVANFLIAQDVRPAPSEADIAQFLGRTDSALFCVLRAGQIEGVASYSLDGHAAHLVHVAIEGQQDRALVAELIERIESAARRCGAAVLLAHIARDSSTCALLLDCGFTRDWEEDDVVDGRVVTLVDLLKQL